MSNVEFDYGRAFITADSEKRLDSLSKALIDRPSLNLEIEGRVDPEQDREGLKKAGFQGGWLDADTAKAATDAQAAQPEAVRPQQPE